MHILSSNDLFKSGKGVLDFNLVGSEREASSFSDLPSFASLPDCDHLSVKASGSKVWSVPRCDQHSIQRVLSQQSYLQPHRCSHERRASLSLDILFSFDIDVAKECRNSIKKRWSRSSHYCQSAKAITCACSVLMTPETVFVHTQRCLEDRALDCLGDWPVCLLYCTLSTLP